MDDFLSRLRMDQVAMLAKHGDTDAFNCLWEISIPVAEQLAKTFAAKYPWIDEEDIRQSLLSDFPKVIRRYDPEKSRNFQAYLYFSFYRLTQDFLRAQDPLGVGIPHKRKYPSWCHLSEIEVEVAESLINTGIQHIDRKYRNNGQTTGEAGSQAQT